MKHFTQALILVGIVTCPLLGKSAKSEEPGELKLNLIKFHVKKSHSLRIKLDWGNGTPLGTNTTANRTQGEGNDALGSFTYVATRVANPEWTEYTLWISYNSGKEKNRSLRLHWVTNGHEPPGNSEVTDGVWIFKGKIGKLSGKVN